MGNLDKIKKTKKRKRLDSYEKELDKKRRKMEQDYKKMENPEMVIKDGR